MIQILKGDCLSVLSTLPDQSVQCCVTSPPYWGLRDYGMEGQIGLEKTPAEYVAKLVAVFAEVNRVLRDDGTLWLNLGDCYATGGGRVGDAPGGGKQGEAWRIRGLMTTPNRMPIEGLKPKDLVGIPWRVAFALQAGGWYLRSDIIWSKPNPMPESVTDRPTKAHEYIFLLSKQERYFYDAEAIEEPSTYVHRRSIAPTARNGTGRNDSGREVGDLGKEGVRNKRTVWTVPTTSYSEAHFATFPPDLIRPCILAGSKPGDTILDPFGGSGTTGQVAIELARKAILIELNPEYCKLITDRTNVTPGLAL